VYVWTSQVRLKMTERHHVRPQTRAAAHFARTGCTLPGHGAEVAVFLQRRREQAQEQEGQGRA